MTAKTESVTQLPYRDRVRLVQERMRELDRPKFTQLKKPARVTSAEKLVTEWHEQNDAHIGQQRDLHRDKVRQIKDAIILGDMEKAVALLQRLGA